jgi:hypothetical protein
MGYSTAALYLLTPSTQRLRSVRKHDLRLQHSSLNMTFPGMLYHVILYKLTNVSEVLSASTIRVIAALLNIHGAANQETAIFTLTAM